MIRFRTAVLALIALVASSASAQDPARAPLVPRVVKAVLLDPTTYAPAIVGWEATHLDWQSSQVFFQHGMLEHNANFTVSGRADDLAVSYGSGNLQILADMVANLRTSALNNVSARVLERLLISRYPDHRRVVRTIGWIERSAMASYWSYRLSAGHFRQWQENQRRGQQLGYR